MYLLKTKSCASWVAATLAKLQLLWPSTRLSLTAKFTYRNFSSHRAVLREIFRAPVDITGALKISEQKQHVSTITIKGNGGILSRPCAEVGINGCVKLD